jgi:hypothetical protein
MSYWTPVLIAGVLKLATSPKRATKLFDRTKPIQNLKSVDER